MGKGIQQILVHVLGTAAPLLRDLPSIPHVGLILSTQVSSFILGYLSTMLFWLPSSLSDFLSLVCSCFLFSSIKSYNSFEKAKGCNIQNDVFMELRALLLPPENHLQIMRVNAGIGRTESRQHPSRLNYVGKPLRILEKGSFFLRVRHMGFY